MAEDKELDENGYNPEYIKTRINRNKKERSVRKANMWFRRLRFLLRIIFIVALMLLCYKLIRMQQWYMSPHAFDNVNSPTLEIINNKIVPDYYILAILRKTEVPKVPIYMYNTNEIKNNCKIKKFEKGKIVVLKENNIKSMYLHCKGQMKVRNEFENGFVYDFAVIEPISYIGAMEIMANKDTYSSTLQATADSIIIEISKEDFINWIENDHKLALDVLHFVSDNMYKQALKTGEVLAYPAICTLINYLINVFESENKDEVFIEKTREEIASILGVSVRTINRNLKILKEEKLLSVSRKGILITKKQCEKLYEKL